MGGALFLGSIETIGLSGIAGSYMLGHGFYELSSGFVELRRARQGRTVAIPNPGMAAASHFTSDQVTLNVAGVSDSFVSLGLSAAFNPGAQYKMVEAIGNYSNTLDILQTMSPEKVE